MDGILDFSRVVAVAITGQQVAYYAGRRSQIMTGRRRVVVAQGEMYGMMRMLGTRQALAGSREPMIVRTLPEAYEALGVLAREFHPVALSTPVSTRPRPSIAN
jgi:hypothetical protein